MLAPRRIGTASLILLPGALTAYTSFQAGGFFAGTPAVLCVVVGVMLVMRFVLAEQPFAGLGRAVAVGAGALGLFAVWILVSVAWSEAPARAVVDFDRALLYWLVLVLLASMPWSRQRLEWAMRFVILAIVAICGIALVTRLFPDALSIDPDVARERLNYPLTYWNALGVMAAVGVVLTVHLACSEREPAVLRVLGAAAAPMLATTLFFTFARGPMAVAIGGVVVYVVLARPRALLSGLLTVGPAMAIALDAADDAELLADDDPTTAAAAAQGEHVAEVLGLCILGVIVARTVLLLADRGLKRIRVEPRVRRGANMAAAAALAAVALVGVVAFDAVGKVSDRIEGFTDQGAPSGNDDLRGRLTDPGNNGRIEQWEIAWNAFRDAPLLGDGAGKFGQRWALEREDDLKVEDAHSLYLESLAELGLVGGLLIAITVGAILLGFAARARGEERHLGAALLGAGLAWAVHAGIDWDWEMPAVTIWLFGLGGMALAADRAESWAPSRTMRTAMAVAVLALLMLPGRMALSQRPLNESVQAIKVGDCERVIDRALASAKAMPVRPEPYELLAFCDWRLGEPELALRMADAAVERDPEWWEPYYTRALIKAAAGQDPRPDALRAYRLNPLEPLARDGRRRFRAENRDDWERLAEEARLPIL
jgi:hypothetical protein